MGAAATSYVHMDSIHSSSSAGSTMPPQPWHPAAVPVSVPTHQHHQVVLYDGDLAAPSPSPSPQRPRNHHHHHQQQQQLRTGGAARRPSSRRRPRPSRKLPTTYITADPASFRRMVHQVTGADELHLPPPLAARPHEATTLCRPAPTRVVAAAAGALLPTLDTSAFLLGSGGAGSVSAPRTTAPAAVDLGADNGAVAVGLGGAGYGGAGGFPTLESWDALLY